MNDWFAQTLSIRWDLYRGRLDQCRKRPSVDSVHDLRVATRRLMALLLMLQSMRSSGGKTDKFSRLLKRQLKSLGPLRDAHVQQQFIEQQVERFPELLLLRKYVKRREKQALKTAACQIRDFKMKQLGRWVRRLILAILEREKNVARNQRLTAAGLKCADGAYAETVRRRQSIDSSDLKTIHKTRVAFKKFRYVVESLPPEITGLTRRDLRMLDGYQRKMGAIQDLEVVQNGLTEFLRGHRNAERLLGPFSEYLRRRQRLALRSFSKSADRLSGFWSPRH
jgi:CHAD domain-containing protein